MAPCENSHLYFSYRHPTPDYRPRLPCASASLCENSPFSRLQRLTFLTTSTILKINCGGVTPGAPLNSEDSSVLHRLLRSERKCGLVKDFQTVKLAFDIFSGTCVFRLSGLCFLVFRLYYYGLLLSNRRCDP